MYRGGVIVEGKKVGTIPQGGQFIFLSKKERLDSISVQGGVPMEDRQEIDSQVDTTEELLEQDSVVLAIALTTSPYYGFGVSVIAPDEFTLRTTNRINRTFLITSFTPPAAIYGVNFGDPIVLNYDSTAQKELLSRTHPNNSRSLLLVFRFCLFEYANYLINNIRIRHFLNKNIHCLSYVIGFFFFKSYFSTGNSIR